MEESCSSPYRETFVSIILELGFRPHTEIKTTLDFFDN